MEPQLSELTKALLTLEGLLYGISADEIISDKELVKLKEWKKKHFDTIKHHPVGDLFSIIDSTTKGRILQEHEKEFLEQFCYKYGGCNQKEDPLTCDSIRMKGYIEGILMDHRIYESEIRSFRGWLVDRPHLKKLDVYNEILEKSDLFLNDRQLTNREMFDYLVSINAG